MKLKKDITFIYMDSAEKSIYTPLAKEAENRGYKVKLTDNIFEKCEIGFYCQHINFPQYSKFSLIMLHDIIQQYGNWPDIWLREPWNKYDIGILPSDVWVNNWNQCSHLFYARPRVGMFKVGWPKADVVKEIQNGVYRDAFYKKYGLDTSRPTVLYAPAWENDHKQDDFVQAMKQLNVNILIKQWDAPRDKFPQVVAAIEEMRKLHENVKNVTILPPATNIFEAIAVADILVSEESSTMCEAVMMGIPAVSVSNWLIPDVTPSRFPQCDYDFVVKTMKEDLSTTIAEMLKNYDKYKKKAENYSRINFSNVGTSSSMIMDIIDDCVTGKPIRYEAIQPAPKKSGPFSKTMRYTLYHVKRELHDNHCKKHPAMMKVWNAFAKVKHMFDKT